MGLIEKEFSQSRIKNKNTSQIRLRIKSSPFLNLIVPRSSPHCRIL